MKITPVNLYNYSFCAKKKNDGSSKDCAKDISVLNDKKETIAWPYTDGACSLVGFFEIDKRAQIKDKTSGAINKGCNEYRKFLRDMQYNGGALSEDAKERLCKEYNLRHCILHEASFEKFQNAESYIEDKINKINQNLKDQINEINSLEPISEPAVLWRGIKNPQDYALSDSNQGKRARAILSLKPDDEIVLDWAPICTSPDMRFAYTYGDGKDLMRIKLPKGTRIGLYDESEVRLPSKSKFKFIGKNNHFGLAIWDFEYLGPNGIE